MRIERTYVPERPKTVEVPLKKDCLTMHVKGIDHPILGKEITAIYFNGKELQIMCGGNVFIIVGATNVLQVASE